MKGLFLTISLVGAAVGSAISGCGSAVAAETGDTGVGTRPGNVGRGTSLQAGEGHELATLGGGCFWGIEHRFRQVPGVLATAVGYTGGTKEHPTYEQVCTKKTGHAEVVLIEFDPKVISYDRILDIFWDFHNPTTLNRQGPDVGTQYRSAIFFHSSEQEKIARASVEKVQPRFRRPIVTQIVPAAPFWIAEDYHQQYHRKTGTAACPIDLSGRG